MAVAIRSQSSPTITSSGTSIVVDMPLGIQAGDYLVAFIHYQGSGSSSDLSAAGWTRIGAAFSASDTAARVTGMFARVATGSEGINYTFSGAVGGARIVGFAVAFTGVDTANPVAYSSPWYKAATSSNTLPVSAEASTANLYTLEIWAGNFASPNSYALTTYDGGLSLINNGYNPAGAENTGVSRSALRVWGGMAPGGGVPAHSITTSGTNTQRCAYLVSLNAGVGGSSPTVTPSFIRTSFPTSSGSGSTFTINPVGNGQGPHVANGDWMIAVVSSRDNAANTKQPTPPAGWTNLVPFGTVGSGTMSFGVWAHKRTLGETTYTWSQSTSESQSTNHRLIVVRNADDVSEWIVGATGTRAGSGGTVTTTAPSITTTVDHTLGLLLAGEYTTAAEFGATNDNSFFGGLDYLAADTLYWAQKDMETAGATGSVTVTYPNAHAHNGIALILGIPGVPGSWPNTPTYVASYRTSYTTTTQVKSVSVTTQPGDLVVVCGGAPRNGIQMDAYPPSGNGLTFRLERLTYADADLPLMAGWSAIDVAGGTNWTLSIDVAAAGFVWGFTVFLFRNADGVGLSADNGNSGILSNTTGLSRPHGSVVSYHVDADALNGSSRAWLPFNGSAPGGGNGLETDYVRVPGSYTVYGGYYQDTGGSIFAGDFGLSAPVTNSASGFSLEILASPTPSAPEGLPLKVSNGTGLVDAYFKLADGAGDFVDPGAYKVLRPGYSSVTQMLAQTTFYCAHRGGSRDYPEMSMYAYGQSALLGYPAFELSLARTSDGVWFGLHDSTLDRTSGVSGVTASSLTWAQVQAYNILGSMAANNPTQAARPYMRWEEIIALYYPSHVIFVDPKVALGFHTELITMMNALPGTPTDHFVAKYFGEGNSGGWPANARAAGYTTWGYYYGGGNWAGWHHLFDILGMDYSASSGDWTSILALGKPVMGHITPDAAAVTTALGKGADGVMVSGVKVNIPPAIV